MSIRTRSASIPAAVRREPAEVQGWVSPGFERLRDLFARQLGRGVGGSALCVYHRGQPVCDVWGGARDGDGRPWQRNTVSLSFSTTKGVAATAVHRLADRGLVAYDAPLARYWPEFAQSGKAGITVRQVLSHRAGMYDLRQLANAPAELLDWDLMTDRIARAEPSHLPGRYHAYHAITYGYLVGELLQRVTAAPYSTAIEELVAQPLNLANFHVGAPESALDNAAQLLTAGTGPRRPTRSRRVAARIVERGLRVAGLPADFSRSMKALSVPGLAAFDWNSRAFLQLGVPSMGGMFSARDLARMYAALAEGGELDGVRLLSAQTLAAATEVQSRAADGVLIVPMRWRLGYHAVYTFRGPLEDAFGHFGFRGSGGWASPRRRLALGFVTNHGSERPLGDTRIMDLSSLAVRCARRCI
jgi:CubicO group peptidase (beta-lactamase class C family)